MGSVVSATKTPVTEQEAVVLLTTALTKSLGQPPPEHIGLYLLALAWIESGRGKSVVCNNPGNLMARGYRRGSEYSVWSGNYWRPEWFSSPGQLHDAMVSGNAPSAFRAYPSAVDGWEDYVALVVKKQELLTSAMNDDVSDFVRALHATYSPDYSDSHVGTFRALITDFRNKKYFLQFRGNELPSSVKKKDLDTD